MSRIVTSLIGQRCHYTFATALHNRRTCRSHVVFDPPQQEVMFIDCAGAMLRRARHDSAALRVHYAHDCCQLRVPLCPLPAATSFLPLQRLFLMRCGVRGVLAFARLPKRSIAAMPHESMP